MTERANNPPTGEEVILEEMCRLLTDVTLMSFQIDRKMKALAALTDQRIDVSQPQGAPGPLESFMAEASGAEQSLIDRMPERLERLTELLNARRQANDAA